MTATVSVQPGAVWGRGADNVEWKDRYPMTERTLVKLDEHELLSFVRNCFEWQNADVFAFGRRDSISRLGEIAGYISMMRDADDVSHANSVKIILPPRGGRDYKWMLEEVRTGMLRAYRRFEKNDEKTAPFVEEALGKLEVVAATDFTSASLVEHLSQARSRQAVIVGEAAYYRLPKTVITTSEPHLAEDVWSAHLHGVMLEAEEWALTTNSYVILDIGEYLPSRASNQELLKSAGDVGLCGGAPGDDVAYEDVIARANAVFDLAAAGEVGKALALIEADKQLSDSRKWIMRLFVLDHTGLHDQLAAILDASTEAIAKLTSENFLGVARVAANADREQLAQDLISRALPNLATEHDLECALQITLDIRRQTLIENVRERLVSLHPGSHLLRSVDGRQAAREGNYAKAAALLGGSTDADERIIGSVFALLANAVSGPGFADPVALSRELGAKAPDWNADIQREIMRSLERAGRRSDAVAMLFSVEVKWDTEWFIFSSGLLGRSLASGSGAVGLKQMSSLIDVAAVYLAEHPADDGARTSVVGLFDAELVGISGIAVMVMSVLERAERHVEVDRDHDFERKQLDDIGRLPQIMMRALKWLNEKGHGVVLAGRDAIPAEVLGEDPDAVLDGLLRMVDHYVPDASADVDVQVMMNFVAVALAVAPGARDRDSDLSVVRGVAVKMLLCGRAQLARDLAMQILTVAGDRPERRRKALAEFADIEERVGRTRHALLALISAFELASDVTWREVWAEQSVLLRILRDVGMHDEMLRAIGSLRKVLASITDPGFYRSRLDMLELHAQLYRHQAGNEGAWSTARLIEFAITNALVALESNDEVLPVAAVLQQLIDHAELDGTEVPAAARELLGRLSTHLAPPYQTLLAALNRLPDLPTIAAVVGAIQVARHQGDVSYDLRLARRMGSRLARASIQAGDSVGFAYSVELFGAQGFGGHGAPAEVKSAAMILTDVEAPLATAVEIASLGLPVVGMALDDRGLMVMTVTADGPLPPTAVATDTFDPEQLVKWSLSFPRGYSATTLSQEHFRGATRRLGLTWLPDRALIVSGNLPHLPPNVMTVDGDLAGRSRSLSTVPSLAWLKASIVAARKGDGSAAAWIPLPADAWYMDTLSLMAGDIEAVLQPMGIPLHARPSTPAALASADLAIVGAHGGLAEDNGYFRGLIDDRHEPTDLRLLTDALSGSRVAVLFVCSGGRVDRHPESGGLVGIAHRLLLSGLDAVVAPSWPIPFTIARPWLGAFLKSWKAGAQIIDACRAGNDEVAAVTSHDLARSLAMTLHGNPFIVS